MLNNEPSLNDLRVPPAHRLEALKGSRSGQHSIRVNDQWRICFAWMAGDAVNVEIIGKRAITAETALRLARCFGTSEAFWLGLQADHDLEGAWYRLGKRLETEVSVHAV